MKAASYNPNPEVITILLKAGANMDHQDYYGATALMYAAGSSNPEVFTILLSAGADGTLKDKSGKTAFDLAKENPALGGTDPYTKVYDLSQADFSKDPVPLPSSFPAKLAGMSEEEITAIALKYHGQGNYRESLNHFYYTTMIKPEAALGYFNMACAYSLLGYLGSSAEYLEIAFQNDETWTLSVIEDTDLNNLRPTSLFREIVSQHGKND
ncbi:MAG: hypothetical protein E4H36_15220 [Spirochaetales bacterium]|nr:MAG: hypothetical protein E4H36_15220 [Spirochaetales bacterium]